MLTFPARYKRKSVEIVSWADGTPAQLRAMLDAEKAGLIDTADYWHVGDTRTVRHSAITGDSFRDTPEQDVVWVLTQKGGKLDEDGNEVAWQVDMRDVLEDTYYQQLSTSGGYSWSDCALRTWCNGAFRDSLPSEFRSLFSKTTMRQYGAGRMESTYDYFAPRASAEIGAGSRVNTHETAELSRIPYYAVEANRKKKRPSTDEIKDYWTRTAYTGAYALDVEPSGLVEQYWNAYNVGCWYSFFGSIS